MNYGTGTEEVSRGCRLPTNGGLTAARTPQVQSSLVALEKQIEELAATITNLEERLSTCTRPSPPEPCQDAGDVEMSVPLAKRIEDCYKHVGAISRRTMRLLQSIEL